MKQLFILVCFTLLTEVVVAQDSTIKAPSNIRPGGMLAKTNPKKSGNITDEEKEITNFKDTKVPEMLIKRITSMSPKEMLSMRDDYMQNLRTDEGEEIVVTTKMRFFEDAIIGWVKEAPLNQSNKELIKSTFINIPVVYCSTASMDNQEHCGKVSEVKNLEETYKITAWKMKVEDEVNDFGDPLKLAGKNAKGTKPTKKEKKTKNKGFTGATGL